ncbi:hypothetical protein Tanf_06935 [Tannerella forsythia]|nr:hypothetical protein Tanf_06935 [Tannerella forsythia]
MVLSFLQMKFRTKIHAILSPDKNEMIQAPNNTRRKKNNHATPFGFHIIVQETEACENSLFDKNPQDF